MCTSFTIQLEWSGEFEHPDDLLGVLKFWFYSRGGGQENFSAARFQKKAFLLGDINENTLPFKNSTNNTLAKKSSNLRLLLCGFSSLGGAVKMAFSSVSLSPSDRWQSSQALLTAL